MSNNNNLFVSLSGGSILIFFLLLGSATSSAHGIGLSLVATSTLPDGQPYQVDVDYSELGFYVGYSGRLSFNLLTDVTGAKEIAFTDVWVRITEGEDEKTGQTIFAAPIYKANYGGAGLLYTFTKPGKYLLGVRYNDSATASPKTLAEGTFLIDVKPYDNEEFLTNHSVWLGAGIIVVVLLIGVYFALPSFKIRIHQLVRD